MVFQDHWKSTGSDPVFQYEHLVALTATNIRLLWVQRQPRYVHALPGLWLESQPHYVGHVVDALDQPGAPSDGAYVV
jgi:hypothetical protein